MTFLPPNLDKVVIREVGISLALLNAEVSQRMSFRDLYESKTQKSYKLKLITKNSKIFLMETSCEITLSERVIKFIENFQALLGSTIFSERIITVNFQ